MTRTVFSLVMWPKTIAWPKNFADELNYAIEKPSEQSLIFCVSCKQKRENKIILKRRLSSRSNRILACIDKNVNNYIDCNAIRYASRP